MPQELDELARRLRRMEREVHFHRAAALLVLFVAGSGLWARAAAPPAPKAPPVAEELRARAFTLVGPEGAALARLAASPEGQPGLVMNGADGRRRIVIEVAGDAARVSAFGLGRSQAALVGDSDAPRLAVTDAVGTDRAWVAVRVGSPVLQFLDAQGTARTGLATFNDDTGVSVISASDRSKPGLVLMGKDRSVIWSAP
jgi:hypothetical protein